MKKVKSIKELLVESIDTTVDQFQCLDSGMIADGILDTIPLINEVINMDTELDIVHKALTQLYNIEQEEVRNIVKDTLASIDKLHKRKTSK